ncbi:MAG: hypothetical protein K8S97_02610, partial [Anaerolineae bacterium]|nr:hypothetical protein [Anaerolineae bacterium]
MFNWTLRAGGNRLFRTAMRIGGRSAVDTALSAAVSAMPGTTERLYTQVFNVTPPTTVYLRASHCRVTIRPTHDKKVTLEATMQRAFGVEFASDQDEAGVYIVVRRKPIVGTVTRADLTLIVPQETRLALHLTPGDVIFESVEGM